MKGVKFVLMLAAGIATGMTVVLAVLVQVLVHMLAMLVAIAVVLVIVTLTGRPRRPGSEVIQPAVPPAQGWTPPQVVQAPIAVPAPPVPALPTAEVPQAPVIDSYPVDSYLAWGPPMPELRRATSPAKRTRQRNTSGCGPARGGRR